MRPPPTCRRVRALAAVVLALYALGAHCARHGPAPVADRGNGVAIDWPQAAILTLAEDRQLVRLVAQRHFGYHALTQAQRARLAHDLAHVGSPASLDQAVCVRNLLYKLQLDTQRERLDSAAVAWYYQHRASGDLAACARHFQAPPLEAARAIVRRKYKLSGFLTRKAVEVTVSFVGGDATAAARLAEFRVHLEQAAREDRRISHHSRRDLLRFARGLTEHDWTQFVWACLNDMQGRPKQHTIDEAEEGERLLEAHLARLPVRFRTERDLRRDQDEVRRSTPDVLFECNSLDNAAGAVAEAASVGLPVVGARRAGVRWLDMKNMYGTVSCGPASDALVDQLAAKAARYTADWGSGAFVLKYGFCESLAERLRAAMAPGSAEVLLLSAASLPGMASTADGEKAPASSAPARSDERMSLR